MRRVHRAWPCSYQRCAARRQPASTHSPHNLDASATTRVDSGSMMGRSLVCRALPALPIMLAMAASLSGCSAEAPAAPQTRSRY